MAKRGFAQFCRLYTLMPVVPQARRFRTCALINSICDGILPASFRVCSHGLLNPVTHRRKDNFLYDQILPHGSAVTLNPCWELFEEDGRQLSLCIEMAVLAIDGRFDKRKVHHTPQSSSEFSGSLTAAL